MTDCLRIATRESPLALWQARHVRSLLQQAHPELQVELVAMTTQGDQLLGQSLSRVGGKGLFVKELERAMLDGRADIAVHSIKDVPAQLPDGLTLACLLAGEDPRDALVSNRYEHLAALPAGARVGTASLRRQAQLRHRRPDLQVTELRGNVGTRLGKLDAGEFDAILLACAGLIRLELGERIAEALDAQQFVPAVGQGVVGIEARADDRRITELLAPLHDQHTAQRVRAERALNARLGGACHVPIAAHAVIADGQLRLDALVAEPDGSRIIRLQISGAAEAGTELGRALAEQLLAEGAGEILAQLGIAT